MGLTLKGEVAFTSVPERDILSACDICQGSGHLDPEGHPAAAPAPAISPGSGLSLIRHMLLFSLVLATLMILMQHPDWPGRALHSLGSQQSEPR
jgi:hypothetical protein